MKDNFSTQANIYAQFRPTYPPELYDFVLGKVPQRHRAWDCATGNGQVATVLAGYFAEVVATDISQRQLDFAKQAPNLSYRVSSAEQTPFADNSFDLITVGQALHWFDFERFNQEVRRVSKPGGVIACWGYELLNISPELDALILDFYQNTVGSYWDPERKHIEEQYARIPFPFEQVAFGVFPAEVYWQPDHLFGYLRTWSAVQRYIKTHQHDPVGDFAKQIAPHWPAHEVKVVTFPMFVQLGVVAK
jgi:SAM-dependent methyltransferase